MPVSLLLLNALLGHEALETERSEPRQGRRHTTVARRMVALPKAGIIVDEPSMEPSVVGHEQGLGKVFP